MELDDLRAFARIADLGGVSAAGRSLGVPKSTISRSLARLEAAVGAVLVDRSTRHLRLTDAGLLFRPYAERVLADVDEAGTALDNFAGRPCGILRVSAPFTFVVAIVSPMLPAFLVRHPEVRVVIEVENRVIDMPVEPADLVIRVGELPDSDLIARHLLTHGGLDLRKPRLPGSASGTAWDYRRAGPAHALIGHTKTVTTTWTYTVRSGAPIEQIDRSGPSMHRVGLHRLEPRCSIAGGGIGRLPDFVARPAIKAGSLVRLFPQTEGDMFDVHALYRSHRSLSAKIRVFIDVLVESLAAER